MKNLASSFVLKLNLEILSVKLHCALLKQFLPKHLNCLILKILKTTIDIPEQALKDAMHYAKVKTEQAAILAALEYFNRRQQMAELVAFSGTCQDLFTFDELMETRERDLPTASRMHST